jgi:hypothetical protein
LGQRSSGLSEVKRSPKRKKQLRTQINGKINDISSVDKNKNITVEPLFKNYKKKIHLFSDEDSEVVPVFERNNASLKELSQTLSEQTSDSSAFLNTAHVFFKNMYSIIISISHFSYLDPDYPTSGSTVTGLAKVYYI